MFDNNERYCFMQLDVNSDTLTLVHVPDLNKDGTAYINAENNISFNRWLTQKDKDDILKRLSGDISERIT